MDDLLKTVYWGSRDEEKREALKRIIGAASEERGAFMNCNIPYPLSFILLTELVCERRDLLRLEKRVEALVEKLGTEAQETGD